MGAGTGVLLLILLAGLWGKNDLMAVAASVMLLLQLIANPSTYRFLESHANHLGITFLLIGLLLPFAKGQIGFTATARSLLSGRGLVAVAIGALGARLASEGVSLLTNQPDVMVGMVFGSVLGVSFLGGIPAGPLVAAGLAALVYRFVP